MIYFTAEWYERMQTWGLLLLHDDEASLQEIKEGWRRDGRDYDEEMTAGFRMALPQLRKYVPEHLLELMDGGRLRCIVPPEEKAAPIREWLEEENLRSEELYHTYEEHFRRIEPRLPPGLREVLDHYSFHDALIVAALQLQGTDTLHLLLDCRGAMNFTGWCTIVFTGVREVELPEDPAGFSWLYGEVDVPEEGGFELRVLLYPRFGPDVCHMRVVAEDIRLEDIRPLREYWRVEEGIEEPGMEHLWIELAEELERDREAGLLQAPPPSGEEGEL
ncbi:DUF4085 family protein [Gorillibacterium sp. sgz5001074]|uniref:DUF4085 family protein n=1 Tax=Gorillibacterium sp. sgz5001074 TaxID=3446695 RepID=UPI003F67EDC6